MADMEAEIYILDADHLHAASCTKILHPRQYYSVDIVDNA
jgi:hypothetical protein